MKKSFLLACALFACASSSFAALTITTPYTYNDGGKTTETTMVAGTGYISEFSVYSYPSLYMNGANVTFDDSSKVITLTATGTQASGGLGIYTGAAWYSMIMKNSTLTFKNGGGLITGSTANAIALYQSNSASTITVEATAGTVQVNKIFAAAGSVTLNLYKANALTNSSPTAATLVGTPNTNGLILNMTANQTLSFDLRTNASAIFNITNNAILTFKSFNIVYTGNSAVIKLADDDLSDGKIFFSNTSALWGASSWNDTTGALSIVSGASTYTLYFKNSTGTAVADIDWVETTGGWYLETPVPEPAAYAAIFGALALGFAAWRKRKQG